MNTPLHKRISVKNIGKTFLLGSKKNESTLSKVLSLVSGRESKKVHHALKNITFEALSGEIVGIIGRNGSGKSTLLRIIAGIYEYTTGTVETNGKLLYLNGFGTGLKPRLTMKENIFLIGSIMGLSRFEIKKRFSTIVEFSGLSEYVDTKIYQFSSGMITRLKFSIGIHCFEFHAPDILLIDEVLGAGGDIDFQKKAGEKMQMLMRGGATALLVSHNLNEIQKYCTRVLWLQNGEIFKSGKTEDIILEYKETRK